MLQLRRAQAAPSCVRRLRALRRPKRFRVQGRLISSADLPRGDRVTGQFVIALDAMGGDRAPEMVVKGANIARQRFPQVQFLFFGDEKRVKPLVDKYRALAKVSTIQHTDQMVKGEDKPSTALRTGRSSSMRLAIDAVQSGDAAGIVSAGN